ncbi:Glutamyl-tRNA synthetase [Blastocystis hominis]|uniref:glutamate--tRNA ligase n=1 Tax=Blastocystis hominis TaxID=12968 RepID=D8M241_BLAHO|nr:Glutamyl-tRNA synthetase [Blastocystis hominis]CBK22130.2 Glutamyl-tRNA synthetase [Blastocystis hominis]|eukprot:XP_012896178.1 Glutamyl-tRNA synthetase [Blastocystis hominis]
MPFPFSFVRFASTTRVRFAPSPTGFMHLGGLRMALINYLIAKKENGKFILRIEDTDRSRLVKGSADNIIRTLCDFGLTPDEGPEQGGPFGPYVQSSRLDIYKKYAESLVSNGSAYYCFCSPHSRKTNSPHSSSSSSSCPCLHLSASEISQRLHHNDPHVIRLRMSPTRFSFHDLLRGDLSIPGDHLEDAVLLKSDGYPTYHLASVVDDHFMQISLVIRGEEWISSVPKHLQLYSAFGWNPPDFIHLPLLLSEQKSKISKRQGGFDAQAMLKEGVLPSALLNYIYYLGLKRGNDETQQANGVFYDLNEMIRDVSLPLSRFFS